MYAASVLHARLVDDEIGIAVRLSIKVPSRVAVITVGKEHKGVNLSCSSRMAESGGTCSPKAQVTLIFFLPAQRCCVLFTLES